MTGDYVVVGHFKRIEQTKEAICKLREHGCSDIKLYSPFPCHELDDEMYRDKPRSPVRMITLLGGVTGCLGAFLMTSWMSVDWPIRTSAKPLISWPAFVIIAFECTILLGAIFTLLGMFHFSRIPNLWKSPGYSPKFSEGTFGLLARVGKAQVENTEAFLRDIGAHQVEVQYVR